MPRGIPRAPDNSKTAFMAVISRDRPRTVDYLLAAIPDNLICVYNQICDRLFVSQSNFSRILFIDRTAGGE